MYQIGDLRRYAKKMNNIFEYNSEWFEYNFIDQEFLDKQLKLYENSEDKDIEHYKWEAYHKVVEEEKFESEKRKEEFLKLIENDPNEHLWKGAITNLIEKQKFDYNWEKLFPNSKVFRWPLLKKKLA